MKNIRSKDGTINVIIDNVTPEELLKQLEEEERNLLNRISVTSPKRKILLSDRITAMRKYVQTRILNLNN